MTDMSQCDIERRDALELGLVFLELAGDDDLLKFLRRLPMVSSNSKGPFTLADFIYEIKLWPFVKEVWPEVEGGAGIAGRIMQINNVYKLAGERMYDLTGERRREARVIDVPTFLQAYSSGGVV